MTDTAHAIYAASVRQIASERQIAGLELERHAHLEQIQGLVDERDALRAKNTLLLQAPGAAESLRLSQEILEAYDHHEFMMGVMKQEIAYWQAAAHKWRRAYSGEEQGAA
jgi:hypothetical protein